LSVPSGLPRSRYCRLNEADINIERKGELAIRGRARGTQIHEKSTLRRPTE